MTRAAPPSRRPILVLGNGGWGTALAMLLHANGHDVRVWGHDAGYARHVEATRTNPKFLPGVRIPDGIRIGASLEGLAEGVSFVVSAIPTQALRSALAGLRDAFPGGALVVSTSKGFERGTHKLPSRIIAEVVSPASTVVLSGPSHAEEVSRGLPATVVAASLDAGAALETQRILSTPRFRIYSGTDPLGVEVGGASKNVIALGAGIADGLGFGDNARAALITRGLHEITRLGAALGACPETFAGLSGMGDLIATATSSHSRNHTLGFRIARGERLEDVVRSTEMVAEGVETTRSMFEIAEGLRLEVPITRAVHAVLFEGRPPLDAVEDLLAREAKDELI